MAYPTWRQRIAAADAAQELLADTGTDPSRQIDVFGLCEGVGLWLAFFPLDGLLGVYLPEGVGGVLITTQRPVNIQRYTAAHELGHWKLGHRGQVSLDNEEAIFGETREEDEVLAQVFAASLMMPPPLVFDIMERLGAGSDISPVHAYGIAREAGVSYEAAVRQLSNLDLVDRERASTLLGVEPLTIKTEIAYGRRPINGRADVWPVDEHWNDQRLSVHVDDEILISLPENRSTGYRWTFDNDDHRDVTPEPLAFAAREPVVPTPTRLESDRAKFVSELEATSKPRRPPGPALNLLRGIHGRQRSVTHVDGAEVVGDDYLPVRLPTPDPRAARRSRMKAIGLDATGGTALPSRVKSPIRVGATGRRILGIRFPTPGGHTLRLVYRTPYADEPPLESYVLHADVLSPRGELSVDQYADDPEALWVADVRDRRHSISQAIDPHGSSDPQ